MVTHLIVTRMTADEEPADDLFDEDGGATLISGTGSVTKVAECKMLVMIFHLDVRATIRGLFWSREKLPELNDDLRDGPSL